MQEDILLDLVTILTLGIVAQWLAWRLKWPSILLLLLFGCAAGPGSEWLFDRRLLDPDSLLHDLLMPVVSLAVAVILFEGGLSLKRSELKAVGGVVRNLMIVGVPVTWALSTASAHWVLGMELPLAMLLGAILVVTGPTVIGPILRQVRPKGQVASALKWEGIINDPIGAIFAVLIFEVIAHQGLHDQLGWIALGVLARSVAIGVIGGVVGAALLIIPLRRYWIPDYLHSPAALVAIVVAFTLSNIWQHESGLLTVTVMGIVLANQKWASVRHIIEFKENLRTLLISMLFIVLGARVTMADLSQISGRSVLFLLALILLVRPISVALSTLGSPLKGKERFYLALIAPRGIVAAAVSAIFALRLGDSFPGAAALAPTTFVVIIGTIALAGFVAQPAARWLGLVAENPQGVLFMSAHAWARKIAEALKAQGIVVMMVDTNRSNVHDARLAGFKCQQGNILAESVMHELDLAGISRFMALTPNDEANALACVHCRELFEGREVYQLPAAKQREPGDNAEASTLLGGRRLFSQNSDWWNLNARFSAGAVVKTTALSDAYSLEDFDNQYGDAALPLFRLSEEGNLQPFTAKDPPMPKAGDRLIFLLDREADEQVRAKRQAEVEAKGAES